MARRDDGSSTVKTASPRHATDEQPAARLPPGRLSAVEPGVDQGAHQVAASVPGGPNRGAPFHYGLVPKRSRWGRDDIGNRDVARPLRSVEFRPALALAGKLPMGALNLPAGVAALDVQIEPDEGEGRGNRLGLLRHMLRGVGVDHMLVNEGRAGVREGVERQRVIAWSLSCSSGTEWNSLRSSLPIATDDEGRRIRYMAANCFSTAL